MVRTTLYFFLLVFSLYISSSHSNELTWSSDLCTELGYPKGRFDYCGKLYFCQNGDNGDESYRRNRKLLRGGGGGGERDGGDEDHFNWVLGGGGGGGDGDEGFGQKMYEYPNDGDLTGGSSEGNNNDGALDTDEGQESILHGLPAKYGYTLTPTSPCTYPGPTIRLQRSKTYALFLHSPPEQDAHPTNLHTHGLHIPGHGNADDMTRTLNPGDTLIYEYNVGEEHMGGTYWYHSHYFGESLKQIGGGAFGMLIVGDDYDDVGTDVVGVKEFLKNERRLIVVNSIKGGRRNSWVGFTGEDSYTKHFDPTTSLSTLTLNKDEWYRLRILGINIDSHRTGQTVYFPPECTVHAIAHDGVYRFTVPASQSKSEYVLSPSSRLDVAIKCSDSSTINVEKQQVVNIVISDQNGDLTKTPFEDGISLQWKSKRPDYIQDLTTYPQAEVDPWYIRVGETNINHQGYDLNQPLCRQQDENDPKSLSDFQYGRVHEWTISKSSHPLHLHMYHLQIVSLDGEHSCGPVHETGEYYDTIVSTAGEGQGCVVRVKFLDVAGRATIHCHILEHAEHGSMGYINVVGDDVPEKQPDEPRVHVCAGGGGGGCDEPVKTRLCADFSEDEKDDCIFHAP